MNTIRKISSLSIAIWTIFFLLAGSPLYPDSLSRFLLERYAFLQFNSYTHQPPGEGWLNSISGDIFLGEFPLILSYDSLESGITLFTGLPRFVPLYLGVGRYTEIGYINMYNRISLIHSLGIGTRIHLSPLKYEPYIFLSSKIGRFAIGGNVYLTKSPELAAGLFLKNLSLSIRLKNRENIYSNISIELRDEFAINLQAGIKRGDFTFTIGMGIYHTDLSDNDYKFDSRKFEKGAHRGSIQKFPENSYPAFKYAMNKRSYKFIEFDVYKTIDNRYVIVHDPTLLRYTGELKWITKLTLDELKKKNMSGISFRKFPTKILTLEDIARELKGSDKSLIIDIKQIGNSEEEIVTFIHRVKELFKNGKPKEITFSSRYPRIVRLLKKNCNNRVALLFPFFNPANYLSFLLKGQITHYLKDTGADMLLFSTSMLDKRESIEELSHQLGFGYAYSNFHDTIYKRKKYKRKKPFNLSFVQQKQKINLQ